MRKIILSLCLFLAACGSEYQIPPELLDNQVKENQQIFYSPSGHFWSAGNLVEDRIMFTKHYSPGSGGYSEYVGAAGTRLNELASHFEFIIDGRLIGYNAFNFKFYEVVWQKNYFLPVKLEFDQVEKLFPGLELIRLSTAQNGVLTVKKLPFATKSFLIYNDTEQDFYKYQFEKPLPAAEPFRSLLTARDYGEYVYSHFGSREALFPLLTVKVTL